MNKLLDHLLENVNDREMVGISIHEVNRRDNPICFGFRRVRFRQMSYGACFTVSQSHSRFNAMNALTVVFHSVKMPVGFGGAAIKRNGKTIACMAQLKELSLR
jgi:hypothetical protein